MFDLEYFSGFSVIMIFEVVAALQFCSFMLVYRALRPLSKEMVSRLLLVNFFPILAVTRLGNNNYYNKGATKKGCV